MTQAQKPDFVFWGNGPVHLNRRGRQFSRLLAAEMCASAVVTLDTPCSEVVWRILAIHSIRQFPLHFPSRASPCAIRFQLEPTFIKQFSPAFYYFLLLRSAVWLTLVYTAGYLKSVKFKDHSLPQKEKVHSSTNPVVWEASALLISEFATSYQPEPVSSAYHPQNV